MSNLLSAYFMSIKKSRLFRVCIVLTILIVVYEVFCAPYEVYGFDMPLRADQVLLESVYFLGWLAALFCSLFLGQEYHDGTIRNRIMAGYRRRDIYLASQITCMLVMFLLFMIYNLTVCLVALPVLSWGYDDSYRTLFGDLLEIYKIRYTAPDVSGAVLLVFTGFFATAAYCSLCVLLAMVNTRKVFSLISSFGVIYLFNYIGSWIADYADDRKTELLLWGYQTMKKGDGSHILDHMPESLVQFLADLIPGAQKNRIYHQQYDHMPHIMVCSVLFVFLLTIIGICFFQKRNIK